MKPISNCASVLEQTRTKASIGLALLLFAAPGLAADGVLEISQACAAVGCFPGDSPGFPVEITANGSYVLTSNLTVPDENTTAIFSSADVMSLDLGGFVISGITNCSGNPVVCSPTGSGRGVDVAINKQGSVRNGTVRGMGSIGISTANGYVREVIARGNGAGGISHGGGTTHNSKAIGNGGFGILCGGGVALDNVVSNNGGIGIEGTVSPIVQGNLVRLNGGANDSPGIRTVDGFVWENQVELNRGPGLRADGQTVYGSNRFRANSLNGPTPANQVTGGAQLGPNFCHSTACP